MFNWQGQAIFTPEEVSGILQMDVDAVHALIRRGELGACRVQNAIGVPPHFVREYQRQAAAWTTRASDQPALA